MTFQLSYETYREQACGVIVSWLNDLSVSTVLGDDLLLRRYIGDALFMTSKIVSTAPDGVYRTAASRLERLFLVYTRFWRAPRIAWMGTFVKVLTADMDYKVALGKFSRSIIPACVFVAHLIFSL